MASLSAYPSFDDSNDLCTVFSDGIEWYGCGEIKYQKGGIDPQSPTSPGVAFFNNNLYLVYQTGTSSDFYTSWYDGHQWNGNTKIKDQPGGIAPTSLANPTAVVF